MSQESGEIGGNPKRNPPRKKHKIGRERPHFFGFQPPKKFWGSLPPCGTADCAWCFFRGAAWKSEVPQYRRKTMSLIKKAPAIVTLEVKIEEPVKQLLEDYARFIDSSPDHVVNSVIKKNLWRDQEYRKWREQHRAQGSDTPKTQRG
jgi:hypothetical protein